MLPKLPTGGQEPVYLRLAPAEVKFSLSLDLRLESAQGAALERWDAFIKALGGSGEKLSDPREWLFGQR